MTELRKNPPWPVSLDVERQLPWLIRDLGFEKIEDRYDGETFGNSYATYTSASIKVRFVYDRGETTAWVASCQEPDNWHSLELVCEFMGGCRNERQLTLAELGELFRNYHEEIAQALDADFVQIKPQLHKFSRNREQENLDRIFPNRLKS